MQPIGVARPEIDPRRMAAMDLHRMKARDGLEIPVWVTRPRNAPAGKPLPAVVIVHSGPWSRGRYWGWHTDAQFLASRGYVVIEPEFRGSLGYGDTLFKAGWKQWGRAMQDDVADATRWAAAQGWADPGRTCIAGVGYGGYAVLMGLIRDATLYRCGIAQSPITDPRLLFDHVWARAIAADFRAYSLPLLLGDPEADAAALAGIAPVEQAANIKTPLLLAYGGNDRFIPPVHSVRLRSALRTAGSEPEWVEYTEEGHGWLKEANRFDFARKIEAFLSKHLK